MAGYKEYILEFKLGDGTQHSIPFRVPQGEDGGYYTPVTRKISDTEVEIAFSPSKAGMPTVAPVSFPVIVTVTGGNVVDLTGYATEQWVNDGYQPKGNYLTEVPSGYATEDFVKNKIAEAALGGGEVDMSIYAQKTELPTKVSQLENDSKYLTEHQDISGKLDVSALPAAINTALAQAQASGEFDGKDGYTPIKGVDYFDGQDGEDGHTPIKDVDYFDGKDGYSPVRGTDYWTAADIAEIKSYVDEAILGGVW